MKYIFLFFSACFAFTFSVSAQITIGGADFPVVGDTSITVFDTASVTGVSVGGAGPSQSWDLLNIANEGSDTSLFVDPSTLPEASDFPAANVAIVDLSAGSRIYADFNISSIDILGFAGDLFETGTDVTLYNVPSAVFAPLPLSYQDIWSSSYERLAALENFGLLPANFDSIYIQSEITSNDTIDGWGTLITPMGVYDALRNVSWATINDSIFGRDTTSGWTLIATDISMAKTYRWWTPGIGPTVEAEMDSTLMGIADISYDLQGPQVGVQEPIEALSLFEVYPNPVTENTRIAYELDQTAEVKITLENILGQEIGILLPSQQQGPGTYSYSPDIQRLAGEQSLVLVKIQVGEGMMVKKLLLEK